MSISLYSGGNLAGAINNGGTITLTFPGGLFNGAVVYLCVGARTGYSIATPGYTQIATRTSGSQVVQVFRKILYEPFDTSVVINGSGSQQDAMAAAAYILRGVDPGSPEDATPTSAIGSSTNPNNPAITTVTSGAWVLAFASSQVADLSVTAPTNYNDQTGDSASDNNSSSTYVAWRERAIPGSEDPAAWTNWSTGAWAAITVAVRPGGVPVTGVQATGQVGVVNTISKAVIPVTGVVGAGQLGTARTGIGTRVLGVQATAQLGTVQTRNSIAFGITGVEALGAVGAVSIQESVQVPVFGVDAQGVLGDALGISGVFVDVFGVQATAQVYGPVYFWYGIDDSQTTVWQDVLT
jgi:hypothetical protein